MNKRIETNECPRQYVYDKKQKKYCGFYINYIEQQLQAEREKAKELEEKFKRFFNIDNQECWDLAFMNDEREKYKQALKGIQKYCTEQNLKFDMTACEILEKCDEVLDD